MSTTYEAVREQVRPGEEVEIPDSATDVEVNKCEDSRGRTCIEVIYLNKLQPAVR